MFSADVVESTFTLEDFQWTEPDYLAVEREATTLSIFVSKACHPQKWDCEFSLIFAKMFSSGTSVHLHKVGKASANS